VNQPLIIRPEAEADIKEAVQWFEDRVSGLGAAFLLSVEAALHAITRSPRQYPLVHQQIRRAMTRRFPYEIFFTEHEQGLVVLAVFHAKRNPSTWQRRR